jgi:hypothetical protein
MLVFIKRVELKRFEWCWKREKVSCKKVVQKRELVWTTAWTLHVVLDVFLIVCLVVLAVA